MTSKRTRSTKRRVRNIPKGRRMDVRREEFNRLIDMLNERAAVINRILDQHQEMIRDQRIQFERIAQIQAELDVIKRAWERLKVAG